MLHHPHARWLRLILGARPARTRGELRIAGLKAAVEIWRDEWSIPHIYAQSDEDAWFALGFCQAQDRGFQIELLSRVVRGTLSEWIGKKGIAVDRLSRRVGFRRKARAQWEVQSKEIQSTLESFVKGVNAGRAQCSRPHEYVFLTARPGKQEPEDVIGILMMMSFLLPSNWDTELVRYKISELDGPEALKAISGFETEPITGVGAAALKGLLDDISLFRELFPVAGGSNNWVISEKKTATGRPLLANDPHLAPLLPNHWYLSHLSTPRWKVAGASLAGAPGIVIGHNEHCAWGVTAGLVDAADTFLERLGDDGKSVVENGKTVACPVFNETIRVRGGETIEEKVLETSRGPIISDAMTGKWPAISLSATWLQARPVTGLLAIHKAKSFSEFRMCFDGWAALSLNFVYGDVSGKIATQLVGQPPKRRRGNGTFPLPAWDGRGGWDEGLHAFSEMPKKEDPACGFLATANQRLVAGIPLGEDWLEGYRLSRIEKKLASQSDWSLDDTRRLQLDEKSLVWDFVKTDFLAFASLNSSHQKIAEAWAKWDGTLSADSWEAAVFEVFLHEMIFRAVKAKAPKSWEWAMGHSLAGELTHPNWVGLRRVTWFISLLRSKPAGWFSRGWNTEAEEALSTALTRVKEDWGKTRTLQMRHALGEVKFFRSIFNLGPVAVGGDSHTINQTGVDPTDPVKNPIAVASLRFVTDVGNWDDTYVSLPGGQSGNPTSPHYSDLFRVWCEGRLVPLVWSDEKIKISSNSCLKLNPSSR